MSNENNGWPLKRWGWDKPKNCAQFAKIVDEKKSKPNATKYTRMACPDNQKWHFSKNHWQNEQTFKQYLMDIVIPYRLEMLDTTNRNESQKLILILDLHWSHKTQYIRKFMKHNRIIPIYIPGQCTDIMQVCDTVVNKPYKQGMKEDWVITIENWTKSKLVLLMLNYTIYLHRKQIFIIILQNFLLIQSAKLDDA